MNILMLYESCTGNTELGAEVVKRTLERDGHACTLRRYRDISFPDMDGYDLYGFATPVQSFAPLTPVHRFLKAMPSREGCPAFIFTTGSGWPGVAHRMTAGLLRKKGMVVLGAHMLACTDNWPISRKLDRFFYDRFSFPRKKSLRKVQSFALEMANRAYRLREGLDVEQAPHRLWPTPTLPLAWFAVRGMLARGLGKRTLDAEACTRCGTCVKVCPVGAVTLADLPTFSDACIGCWACFNMCPSHAIVSSVCAPRDYFGGLDDPESFLKKVGL